MQQTIEHRNLSIGITEHGASPDFTGECSLTLSPKGLELLKGWSILQYNARGECTESALVVTDEDEEGFDLESGLCTNADFQIAAYCALVEIGEPVSMEWEGSEAYWAFHDLDHASNDFSACDNQVESPHDLQPEMEDRANRNAAKRMHGLGYSLGSILTPMQAGESGFAGRFGAASVPPTGVEDFLAWLPEDETATDWAAQIENWAVEVVGDSSTGEISEAVLYHTDGAVSTFEELAGLLQTPGFKDYYTPTEEHYGGNLLYAAEDALTGLVTARAEELGLIATDAQDALEALVCELELLGDESASLLATFKARAIAAIGKVEADEE